jgi:hypothetical protein
MKTKHIPFISAICFIVAVTLFFSCRKEPHAPPIKPFVPGTTITIQELRNMWNGISYKFNTNTTLYAVVTADESSGQLYKEVYVRDHSGTFSQTNFLGAISLHFLHGTSGFLTQGDSIAVNLNGARLDESSGYSLEIDSLVSPTCIQKLGTGLNTQPLVVTLPQLNTYGATTYTSSTGTAYTYKMFIYDGQLVQINNVEFVSSEIGTTYATPSSTTVNVNTTPPVNVNKFVCDAAGNTFVAYNSGYSNFANNSYLIPNNSGNIVAIANLYGTMQLNIRSYADMSWANTATAPYTAPYFQTVYDSITQNFSCAGLVSNYTVMTAGWQTFDIQGNMCWVGGKWGSPTVTNCQFCNPPTTPNTPNFSYNPSVSNYNTSTVRNDIWLISPPIVDHNYATSGATGTNPSKYIDFSCGLTYGTNDRLLSVLVSNTFDGTHIIPSQWTDISSQFSYIPHTSGTASSPNFQYASSTRPGPFTAGPVAIHLANPQPHFYLAFRYQSSTVNETLYPDSTGSTYWLGTLVLRNY